MMDESNRAPVPEELTQRKALQQQKEQQKEQQMEDLLSQEDRLLDRLEAAATARQESQRQEARAQSVIRTRPLLLPPKPLPSRGRGRR